MNETCDFSLDLIAIIDLMVNHAKEIITRLFGVVYVTAAPNGRRGGAWGIGIHY